MYPYHAFIFGGIVLLGSWISMMISCFNGTIQPLLAEIFGFDPAKIAGPLETAFQDIVGQSLLLGISLLIFTYTEPYFALL